MAGRPKKADAGALYAFAHQFYWDLRRLVEGGTRSLFDEKRFKEIKEFVEGQNLELSEEEELRLQELVGREVRDGHLKDSEKENRLREMRQTQLFVTRDWLLREATQEARKELRIPGEPEIFEALLQAKTPEQVRNLCDDAFVPVNCQVQPGVWKELLLPNWPISGGSVLPHYLSQYACEFLAAKNDPRFPRSTVRITSRLKQLWFVSRALAGALYGIKTRTAINLVGSKRPEEVFEESGAARPARGKKRSRDRTDGARSRRSNPARSPRAGASQSRMAAEEIGARK